MSRFAGRAYPMGRKVIAIVQARMGSSRLPGKSLERIGNWQLIDLVLHRTTNAKLVDKVVLATTVNPLDDVLENHVSNLGFEVYRGSEEDVLSRFYYAAKRHNPEAVVRVTGDCPLISPFLIDSAVACFLEKNVDYLALSIGEEKLLAFPRGLDVEVAGFSSLRDAFKNAKEKYEREHVTPYLYTRDEHTKYYIKPSAEESRPKYRFCVDTARDLEMIRCIYSHFGNRLLDVEVDEIIEFLDRNPGVVEINQGVRQKHYKEVDERY